MNVLKTTVKNLISIKCYCMDAIGHNHKDKYIQRTFVPAIRQTINDDTSIDLPCENIRPTHYLKSKEISLALTLNLICTTHKLGIIGNAIRPKHFGYYKAD